MNALSAEQRQEAQATVCEVIAGGGSADKAAMAAGISKALIYKWLQADEAFCDQYTRAREARADARAERIDEICQEVRSGSLRPDAARVIIDAEKWQAGKENAKRYGDRLQLDTDVTVKLTDEQLDKRLAQLLGKAGIAAAPGGAGSAEGEA